MIIRVVLEKLSVKSENWGAGLSSPTLLRIDHTTQSVTLPIIGTNLLAKIGSIIVVSLPFVVGSFYIIGAPQPDRHLSQTEADNLLRVFVPLANSFPNNIQVEAVSASPDAAGYGQQFMAVLHAAGLTVNGVAPTDSRTAMFPSSAQVYSSQMRGLYIGVSTGVLPPAQSAIRFQAAFSDAGFQNSIDTLAGSGSR